MEHPGPLEAAGELTTASELVHHSPRNSAIQGSMASWRAVMHATRNASSDFQAARKPKPRVVKRIA